MLKLTRGLSIIILSAIILGCNCSNGSNNDNNQTISNIITIDNAGLVPIIGNVPTTSVIYVHNNGDKDVSNISYTSSYNTGSGDGGFLSPASIAGCKVIKAGQSCPLMFTTPIVDTTASQGSALISLSYTQNNSSKVSSFNRVISYAVVNDIVSNGVVFNSDLLLTGNGNKTAYGTLYIYGSGHDQIYNIESILSSRNIVQITQGNIAGDQVKSNFVHALEISAPIDSTVNLKTKRFSDIDGYNATITINSLNTQSLQNYVSVANLSITPASNGAILTSGQNPMINTAEVNPNGMIYITNLGNSNATIGTITYPSGVTGGSGNNQCSSSLLPGAVCILYFNIVEGSNGSGDISIPYTTTIGGNSGTLLQTIAWYNGKGSALLNMSSSISPINFNQGQNESAIITVTNVGGYNLTNIQASIDATGNVTSSVYGLACVDASTNPTSTNLLIGGSCTYNILLNDTIAETGYITTNISGSYGSEQVYTRSLSIEYNSLVASINISSLSAEFILIGGESVTTAVVSLDNSSGFITPVPVTITSNNPSLMSISPSSCSLSANSESCVVRLSGISPGINATFSAGSATSSDFIVRYPIAYITNFGSNSNADYYTKCNILDDGIESASCVNIAPLAPGTLNGATQMAIYQGYAYFVNFSGNSYTQCQVSESGIESDTCVTNTPVSLGVLNYPYGIVFAGQYAYISNYGSNSYTQCSVNSSGIESASCSTMILNGILSNPAMMAISGNYLYFSNGTNDTSGTYAQCTLSESGLLDPNSCNKYTPQPGNLIVPYDVAFNGDFAYFTNWSNDGYSTNGYTYTQCNVVNNIIQNQQCTQITPLAVGYTSYPNGYALGAPNGLTFYNNKAYFINQNNQAYTQCNVAGNGSIESNTCSVTQINLLDLPQFMVVY